MALDDKTEQKELYAVGEIPPLGHVPSKMHAWAIRRERQGEPEQAMQLEVVDVPRPDSTEVLVMVMAAGVNYNGIWAGLGVPISMFDVHKQPYHIAGSDAAGIVWAVGDKTYVIGKIDILFVITEVVTYGRLLSRRCFFSVNSGMSVMLR